MQWKSRAGRTAEKAGETPTSPMARKSVTLKDAAVRMGCGKLVAPGTSGENLVPGPTYDTPCSASDHHSYAGMPSRGSAACLSTRNPTFSASDSRDTRSPALADKLADRSQNAYVATVAFDASHANTGVCARAGWTHSSSSATATACMAEAENAVAMLATMIAHGYRRGTSTGSCIYTVGMGKGGLVGVSELVQKGGAARDKDGGGRRGEPLFFPPPFPCAVLAPAICVLPRSVNPSILGGFLSALLPFITNRRKKTVLNGPFAGCRAVLFSTRTDFASLSK
jgi:hypothetical protein